MVLASLCWLMIMRPSHGVNTFSIYFNLSFNGRLVRTLLLYSNTSNTCRQGWKPSLFTDFTSVFCALVAETHSQIKTMSSLQSVWFWRYLMKALIWHLSQSSISPKFILVSLWNQDSIRSLNQTVLSNEGKSFLLKETTAAFDGVQTWDYGLPNIRYATHCDTPPLSVFVLAGCIPLFKNWLRSTDESYNKSASRQIINSLQRTPHIPSPFFENIVFTNNWSSLCLLTIIHAQTFSYQKYSNHTDLFRQVYNTFNSHTNRVFTVYGWNI